MNRKQRRMTRRHRPNAGPSRSPKSRVRREEAARWIERGQSLQSRGRIEDAITAFRNALRAYPHAPEIHGILAAALRTAGQASAAIATYRRAIEIDPTNPTLYNNLGNAYLEQGATDMAVSAYQSATDLDPAYANAQSNLGLALSETGQFDDALTACRRAVALEPNRPEFRANLAAVLEESGRFETATTALDEALALFPNVARLRWQKARLLIKTGKTAAAETDLRTALKLDSRCVSAYYELADIKRLDLDNDLMEMEGLAASPGALPPYDRIALQFALARAYEDAGRYDDAFSQLQLGNRLKRDRLPYDHELQVRLFDTIASVFDQEQIRKLTGSGDPTNLPIFIVGMPRSGTTLLERMLGRHARITGAGELRYLIDIARGEARPGDPVAAVASLRELDPARCRAMGLDYVNRIRGIDAEAERIVDKMPSNFLRIGLISVILPHAKIIHCRRNPVDTCLSCFQQLFAHGQSFSYDLQDVGRYYTLYRKIMKHWQTVLPDRIFDVDYETLIAQPEIQLRGLLEHCGLPWDPNCLTFHTDTSPVQTASASQVRRPIYKSSVGRWRRFERHLKPLLETLAEGHAID